MIIYGLKNCDRCKAFLKGHPDFKFIDISIIPVPENILKEARHSAKKLLVKKYPDLKVQMDALKD